MQMSCTPRHSQVCAHSGKSNKKGAEESPEWKQLADQFGKTSGNMIFGMSVILMASWMVRTYTHPNTQEISFQHFKTQLLAKDVVDRIEVANKTTAKVCHHLSRLSHTWQALFSVHNWQDWRNQQTPWRWGILPCFGASSHQNCM